MNKRTVSLLLGFCLLSGLVLGPAARCDDLPIGLDAMWKAGDRAFEEKHFKDAAGWYEKVAAYGDFVKQPKSRRAQFYQDYGRALVYSEQFDKAIDALNRSIDLVDQTGADRPVKEAEKSSTYDLLAAASAGKSKYLDAAEWLVKESVSRKERFPNIKSDGLLECRIGGWYWRAGMKDQAEKWLSEGRSLLQQDLDSGKAVVPDLERDMLKKADSALTEIHSKVR